MEQNNYPFDFENTPHEPEPQESQSGYEPQHNYEPQATNEPQPNYEPQSSYEPQSGYEQNTYTQPPVYDPQPPVYGHGGYHQQPFYQEPMQPTPPRRQKKKHTGLRVAVIALCFALLGSAVGAGVTGVLLRNSYDEKFEQLEASIETQKLEQSQNSQLAIPVVSTDATLTPAEIYAANVPAIVGIANESTSMNIFGQTSATASTGTGFIISADGEILTNYHVVEGAQTLTVTLSDGTEYPATVLGYDADSDVALLKINASNLPTVTLGSSDELAVGSGVAAIGNPLGELTYSLTVGYLSATDREINTDGTPINMMQIDAAINPGNSGGPLFNMKGEVIGITTAKYSGTTSSGTSIEGIGFAIPIDDVLDILDDLRESGGVTNRAYIGIRAASVTSAESEAYGLPMGVLVSSVESGSCGEQAGLRKSDIITAIDGNTLESYEDLARLLKKYRAGDAAELTVYRSGQVLTLHIVFDAKPQSDTQTDTVEPTEASENYSSGGDYGGWSFPWSMLP